MSFRSCGAFLGLLLLASPASAWLTTIDGGSPVWAEARMVTPDADGNAVAAGAAEFAATGRDFTVAKLAAATGALLWVANIDGTAVGPNVPEDEARDVAIDAAGDVIAVGSLEDFVEEYSYMDHNFVVAKFDGESGAELWRQVINGEHFYMEDFVGSYDQAHAVALDAAGDVLAAGFTDDLTIDFAVSKLSGATGVELWRALIDVGGQDIVYDVAVDAAGDVFAAGFFGMGFVPYDRDFAVVKFDGSSGAELWRKTYDGSLDPPYSDVDWARALALTPAGDVVAAGELQNIGAVDMTVVKLAGATGAELWRTELNEAGSGEARAMALDADGDVLLAGELGGRPALVKLAGSTGAELWRHVEPDDGLLYSVALGPGGEVFAAGFEGPAAFEKIVVVALDEGGSVSWHRLQEERSGRAVALDAAGDVLVAGRFAGDPEDDFGVQKLVGATGASFLPTLVPSLSPFGVGGLVVVLAGVALAGVRRVGRAVRRPTFL